MQKSLDSFVKKGWIPILSKDENIQRMYMKVDVNNSSKEEKKRYVENKDKSFSLQEYADKISAYMKEKSSNHKESNANKLN